MGRVTVRILAFAAALCGQLPVLAAEAQSQPQQVQLACDKGPVAKTYGKSPWLLYSCSDGHSLLLMAAPGSAATPFYFMLWWNGAAHQLHGEGTGDKAATDAAFAEIGKLTEPEITALLAETGRR